MIKLLQPVCYGVLPLSAAAPSAHACTRLTSVAMLTGRAAFSFSCCGVVLGKGTCNYATEHIADNDCIRLLARGHGAVDGWHSQRTRTAASTGLQANHRATALSSLTTQQRRCGTARTGLTSACTCASSSGLRASTGTRDHRFELRNSATVARYSLLPAARPGSVLRKQQRRIKVLG